MPTNNELAEANMSDPDRRDSDEEARYSNEEKGAFLLPILEHELEKVVPVAPGLSRRFWISVAVNTICTALIVSPHPLLQ